MKNIKGKALVGLASTALLGGIVLGSVNVLAADEGVFPNTTVTVGFGDGHVENPDPQDGTLELSHIPGLIDFGDGHTAGTTLNATGTTTPANAYVTWVDDRDAGTGDTWSLKAKASALTSTDGTETIDSGSINLTLSDVTTWDADLSTDPQTRPAPNGTTVNNIAVPGVTQPGAAAISLDLDQPAVSLASTTTSARQGYGVKLEQVKLAVTTTADAAEKTFDGEITWTLDDTI